MKSLLKKNNIFSKTIKLHFNSDYIVYLIGFVLILYTSLTQKGWYYQLGLLGLSISWFTIALKKTVLFTIEISLKQIGIFFTILLTIMWLFTSTFPIPFRGDEGFHIQNNLFLVQLIKQNAILLGLVSYILLIIISIKYKKKYILFIFLVVQFILIKHHIELNQYELKLLFRWPILSYIINFPVIIIGGLINIKELFYQEWIYRTVPLFSSLFLAHVALIKVKSKISELVVLMGVLSTPVLIYYSSVNYQELFSVLLVLLALVHWYKDEKMNQIPLISQWLMLLSMVWKDSFLLYVLLFLASRFVLNTLYLLKSKQKISTYVLSELNLYWIFIPPIVFKLLQYTPYDSSGFGIAQVSIFDIQLILKALFEQLGLITIMPIVLIFSKADKIKNSIVIVAMILTGLFYLINPVLNAYLGYSRYSLIFIAYLMVIFVNHENKMVKLSLMICTILINFNLIPIDFSRRPVFKPMWGDNKIKTSELYYPYNDLYALLSNKKTESIYAIGRSYYYYDSFYHFKYKMNLTDFRNLINKGGSNSDYDTLLKYKPEYVIYQKDVLVDYEFNPLIETIYNCDSTFRLGKLELVLFKRK